MARDFLCSIMKKVMSLGDIAIYTSDGGEAPLADVLEKLKEVEAGSAIDIKAVETAGGLREEIAKALPNSMTSA